MVRPFRLLAASALPLLAAAGAGAACAGIPAGEQPEPAAANGSDGGEIVVTAERREETIVRTPIAVSVLSGTAIERAHLDDVKDLVELTPGFAGNTSDSFIDTLAIRGITTNDYGIGGDPSIGVFKDGVYQGRTGSVVTSLYDVDRTEALRGPQGFLFGRNAISGAISVVTTKPRLDTFEGYLDASWGEANRRELEGALNVPLGEGLALRIAGDRIKSRGWMDNVATPGDDHLGGEDRTAGRATLLWSTGALKLTLTGEAERRRGNGDLYRATNADREVLQPLDDALGTDIVVGGGRRDIDSDLLDPRDDGTIASVNGQIDYQFGGATLTAITAYRRHRLFYSEDYDGTPFLLGDYTQRQHGDYLSQEVRLVSASKGPLTWSLGVSGYREHVRARFTNLADERMVCTAGYGYPDCDALTEDYYGTPYTPAPGGVLVDVNAARTLNTGLSAYGDANWSIIPALQLGAGLRYTWDRKRFGLDVLPSASSIGNLWTFSYYTDGFLEASRSWAGFTPRLYLRGQLTPTVSAYASITRGYKAGGFGSFTVDAPSPVDDGALVPPGTKPNAFAPETVWSKEVGLKAETADHRLHGDLTGFHYVYTDLQTLYFDPTSRTQQVINVGRVRGLGVEASASGRVSRYLDLLANLTWTRTVKSGDRDCDAADCGGLPNPTWTASGIATGHLPLAHGEAYASLKWDHESHRRETFDWRGLTRRARFTRIDARLGWNPGGAWEAELYADNLFNGFYYGGAEDNGDQTPATIWGVAEGRNVGVELRWRFGAKSSRGFN